MRREVIVDGLVFKTKAYSPAAVRRWAREQRLSLKSRGRIPDHVVKRYLIEKEGKEWKG